MRSRSSNRLSFFSWAALALPLLSCARQTHNSDWENYQKTSALSYKVESKSPFVTKWANNLQLSNGVTVSLDAVSFSTIGKFIKYSDEPVARSLGVGDSNLLDIRYNSKTGILYLLTGGDIWSEDVKNHYILVFDLNKREVTSKVLLSHQQFSLVQLPQPGSA